MVHLLCCTVSDDVFIDEWITGRQGREGLHLAACYGGREQECWSFTVFRDDSNALLEITVPLYNEALFSGELIFHTAFIRTFWHRLSRFPGCLLSSLFGNKAVINVGYPLL